MKISFPFLINIVDQPKMQPTIAGSLNSKPKLYIFLKPIMDYFLTLDSEHGEKFAFTVFSCSVHFCPFLGSSVSCRAETTRESVLF